MKHTLETFAEKEKNKAESYGPLNNPADEFVSQDIREDERMSIRKPISHKLMI